MSLDHYFIPSNNPRNHDCARCGRPRDGHQAPLPIMRRNPELEKKIVEEAAKGFLDADALITHCQSRAYHLSGEYVTDPLTIKPGVDRPREMREELCDFVNHALFYAQENLERLGDDFGHEIQFFIRGAAILYNRLLPED